MEEPVNPLSRVQTGYEGLAARCQAEQKKLFDDLDKLRTWDKYETVEIFDMLDAGGKMLFCHYARAWLEWKGVAEKINEIVVDVWKLLSEAEKSVWAEATPQMIMEEDAELESLLMMDNCPGMSSKLRKLAQEHCKSCVKEHATSVAIKRKREERKHDKKTTSLAKQTEQARVIRNNLHARAHMFAVAAGLGDEEESSMRLSFSDNALFCYHAKTYLMANTGLCQEKVEAIVLQVWDLLRGGQRAQWLRANRQFLSVDEQTAHGYLITERSSKQQASLVKNAMAIVERCLLQTASETANSSTQGLSEPAEGRDALVDSDDGIDDRYRASYDNDAQHGYHTSKNILSGGQKLFRMHAAVYISVISDGRASKRDIELTAQEMWNHLPAHHQMTWANSSSRMSTIGAQNYFVTDGSTYMSARFQSLVQTAYRNAESALSEMADESDYADDGAHISATGSYGEDTSPGEATSIDVCTPQKDGQTLFCYHAAPIISGELKQRSFEGNAQGMARELWRSLPEERREEWKRATYNMVRAKTPGDFGAYLDRSGNLAASKRVDKLVQANCKEWFFNRVVCRTPVLTALVGTGCWSSFDIDFVDRILGGIRRRQDTSVSLTALHGRHRIMRVSYDPDNTSVTGIGARLRELQATGAHRTRYESLLTPLALWNRKAFSDIPDDAINSSWHKSLARPMFEYRSQWLFHPKCHRSIQPIRKERAAEVADAVVESVRARCQKVYPDSLLLLPLAEALAVDQGAYSGYKKLSARLLKKHSLYSSSEGLGAQVMRCFEMDGTAAEYEDRIESVLYGFKLACKAAVYG